MAELLGTQLAAWFGLPTFDFAVMDLTDADEVPFVDGGAARSGPAFVTRKARGHSWSGSAEELALIENPEDIAGLVVVDTWLRNPDRSPPRGEVVTPGVVRRDNLDNVFLAATGARAGRLLAMDFSHAFTWGAQITARLGTLPFVREEAVYGLFDEFRPYVTSTRLEQCGERLARLDARLIEGMIRSVPRQWQFGETEASALRRFALDRAHWLADKLHRLLGPYTAEA